VTITEAADSWRFRVLLSSRGDVTSEPILTDPQGQQAGLDRKIPDAGTGTRSIMLDVRQPMEGSYMLQVTGTAPGATRWTFMPGIGTARPPLGPSSATFPRAPASCTSIASTMRPRPAPR